MSSEARRRRQEIGRVAQAIFREHITSATKQLQKILVPFKMELVKAEIVSEEAVDLSVLGVGQLQLASELYGVVMTAMEVMPDKFSTVVAILYRFPELRSIAEEMEEKGIAAGLMTSRVKKEAAARLTAQRAEVKEEVTADVLSDPPTLVTFLESVAAEIPSKWRRVGLALGVDASKLDGFEEQYRGDPMRCYERVFQAWQCTKTFTWSALFAVLEKKMIGENRLAESLRQKFIKP